MNRVYRAATEIRVLARLANEGYEELYEASLHPITGGQRDEANPMPPGKSGFRVSDATGDVAVSGMHKRMRYHAAKAARKLEKCRPILDEVEAIIKTAFEETDPDSEFRETLARLRELEEGTG